MNHSISLSLNEKKSTTYLRSTWRRYGVARFGHFLSIFIVALSFILLPALGFSADSSSSSSTPEQIKQKSAPQAKASPQKKGPKNSGTMSGTIHFNSGELANGGIVSFFRVGDGPPPDMGSARQVPVRVGKINPDGSFKVMLDAGSYHLGAMQWYKGRRPGPPRPGEKFIFIYDEKGKLAKFRVATGKELEVGLLTGSAPDEFGGLTESFSISGKITNEVGEPFENAVVLLKKDMNAPRPSFISEPTKKDGAYSFIVPPGVYFIIARQQINAVGRPRPGSYLGSYGEAETQAIGGRAMNNSTSTPVTGKDGESIANIDITMFKLQGPETRRKEIQDQVKAQKIEPPVGKPPISNTK